MKQVVIFVITILLCSLLALWSPWLYWNLDFMSLFGIQKPKAIAGLQVATFHGEMEVYIDSVVVGKVTPEKSPLIIDTIEPGERLISLKRLSSINDAYWDYNKLVKFEEGKTVVIAYDLGPSEEFSEGHLIYLSKKENSNEESNLNVKINATDVDIQIDNIAAEEIVGTNYTTKISLEAQKNIKISKKGFESLEFTLLPEKQEDRDKLKGFDLEVEVQLMYLPIEIE